MKRPKTDPGLAVAYIRVSTDAERQELGIEAQRHAIREWADRNSVKVVSWHTEEVSGGAPLTHRPVLLDAIADVEATGSGHLVVAKLDRFSRDIVSAVLAEQEIRRHGASLVTADGNGSGDDPTAELVRGILLAVAKFERAMIAARIKAALAVKKRRGEMTGSAPFGYRVSDDRKTLEPDQREQAVVDAIKEMRSSGMSVRGIVYELSSLGLKTRTGGRMCVSQVHRIIKSSNRSSAAGPVLHGPS